MELTLRDIPAFPPPWSYVSAGHPGERRGRVAARRALVDLKLCVTRAAAEIAGEHGAELQKRARQAGEPIELWLLRGAILAALPADSAAAHRRAMEQALRQVFPAPAC
jgi:hypothetical protein